MVDLRTEMIVPVWWLIPTALMLDLLCGDPRCLPHPVKLIGRLIIFLERQLRSIRLDGYFGGLMLCLTTVLTTASFTAAAVWGSLKIGYWPFVILSSIIAYSTVALRSLHTESAKVAAALESGDIAEARRQLSMIVGRDTAELDQEAIWRATIETVAENSNDGVIAPLFWLSVGGPVAAMAFKASSTLDSMVGYKNQKYAKLGMASARLDDLLCFIPARLTAILMILSAPLAGLSFSGSLKVFLRDRKNHESPNSAQPEAAAAGAIGVRLGGPSSYGGIIKEKPFIGDHRLDCGAKAYHSMIRLLYVSTGFMTLICSTSLYLWSKCV